MKNYALAGGGLSTCAVIALLSSATAEPLALNSSEYISGTKIEYETSANGEVISFDNGRTINLAQGVLENVELHAPASGALTVENPFTIEKPRVYFSPWENNAIITLAGGISSSAEGSVDKYGYGHLRITGPLDAPKLTFDNYYCDILLDGTRFDSKFRLRCSYGKFASLKIKNKAVGTLRQLTTGAGNATASSSPTSVSIEDSTVTSDGEVILGYSKDSQSNFSISSGSYTHTAGNFQLGHYGNATMTITGGDVLIANDSIWPTMSLYSPSSSKILMTGGTLTIAGENGLIMGNGNGNDYRQNTSTALVSVAGSARFTVSNMIYFSSYLYVKSRAEIALSGNGVMEVGRFDNNAGYKKITADGGTIRVLGDGASIDFMPPMDETRVDAGGLTFDTGNNIASITDFAADGKSTGQIRKIGSGTLVFTKLPQTGGGLSVAEGTLCLAKAASVGAAYAGEEPPGALTLSPNTIFDLGGNAISYGSIAGAGTVQNGTLTVTDTLAPDGKLTLTADVKVTGTVVLREGETIETSARLDLTEATVRYTGRPPKIKTPVIRAIGGGSIVLPLAAADLPGSVVMSGSSSTLSLSRIGTFVIVR